MEKINIETEIKLLEYLDGMLSPEDSAEVGQMIRDNQRVRERFEQLREMHALIAPLRPMTASPGFTGNVLHHLHDFPKQADRSSIWKGIMLLAGIFVTVGIASMLVSAGVFDTALRIDLNPVVRNEYTNLRLPSIPFSGRTIVNIIIVLNLVIAFFVLDRTVLKPWFRGRVNGAG